MEPSSNLAPSAPFDRSGGDLSLDFANTWGDRGRPETDDLGSYPRLLAFARQTDLVAADVAEALATQALADPAAAEAALQAARTLREALYGLFSARAHGRAVPPADLSTLNRTLREALPHLCLAFDAGPPAWRWREMDRHLTAPLWPIARAAADLLTAENSAPVRECGGSQCTWLFLDLSRSRSRRWCSMTSCGNREKARRHYHRVRKQKPGPGGTPD
ncbi:MAG TPA: ABATE domain-containing protein [Holophagaceae bacterium]|uniref:CGNR zinc finger domain-containing protein n=1 Tax=Geothrix mesophila TaxID=2922723 RepID=UPI001FAD538E|nr:ABATE domain-containing protein [Geothrix sp. SG198]HJV91170.1 ABATE domain-containing protein [Holophagaceae bacterium]